jgi:hypothetical protein
MGTEVKKLSPNAEKAEIKAFPENLLKKVFDKDDNVLFGSNYTKGKVSYNYIPAEYMTTGRPFIIHTSILYDGKGNKDLPKDSLIMTYKELKTMFPDNEFTD